MLKGKGLRFEKYNVYGLLMCLSHASEEISKDMWEGNTAGAFLTAGYSA